MTDRVYTRRVAIWDLPAARLWAWAAERFHSSGVRFAVCLGSPAQCTEWLRSGQVELGLLSPLEYARHQEHYELVPGVSISTQSANPAARLFLGRPLDQIQSIALDPRALGEAVIAYVVLLEHYQRKPVFVPLRRPDLEEGLRRADAVLLVGEEALLTRFSGVVLDLGQEWFELTAMPLVWALWAAPTGGLDDPTVRALVELRQWADAHRGEYLRTLEPAPPYRDYWEQVRIDLDPYLQAGLETLLEYCFLHGLLDEFPMLDFYRYSPPDTEPRSAP
ncbi:MAG: hypothetical protein N2561_00750 [Bacteroidetes bacterium]|nr:hypothetical protein [Rhodothermia bacterium]MCX7906056.1 hypothetical protein [Bacteroidota bacterium]MDW8138184.1 MqnA/MqnD/SBP family protein [Bacteroidota bacterium]MDW8285868.1 MqnA/MqnD/SBP family protein [Bacteroidota bacterium]